MYVFVLVCACICVRVSVCLYMGVCVCMYGCACVYMCMYVCVHVCVNDIGMTPSMPKVYRNFQTPPLHSTPTHSLILRVTAGMNDAVHVKVEVIELHLVGVGLGGVHWDL